MTTTHYDADVEAGPEGRLDGVNDDAEGTVQVPMLQLEPPRVTPPSFDQLWRALRDAEEGGEDTGPERLHRVVTVFSPKGGCGTTVTAVNLAVLLARGGRHAVCLVDLDIEFGDVSIMTGLAPTRSLLDAVGQNPRSAKTVDNLLTPWRDGIDCVLAPVDPSAAERIGPKLVAGLLETLRSRYDYVVVDTPSHLAEHVLDTLDAADHQVLVSTPQLPALKSLRLVLDTLQLLGYPPSRRSVLLNQCEAQGLGGHDVEAAIAHPVTLALPVTPDVSASVDTGVPLAAERPDHPFVAALAGYAAETITGEPAPTTARRPMLRLARRRTP